MLAEIDGDYWRAVDGRDRALDYLHGDVGDRRNYRDRRRYGRWSMSDEDVLARAAQVSDPSTVRHYQAFTDATDRVAALAAEATPLEDEYARRPWPRAFLVDNADGHVHSSKRCSTCNNGEAPTRFHWVTELSGASEDEIVADAGERACTTCYPTAPVDLLKNPSRIEGPNQKAAREESERRAAEKAAQQQKTAAEQVLDPVTGEQLFKTERGATNFISGEMQSMHWYGPTHPSYPHWEREVRRTVEAVAVKRGADADVLYAELDTKAAKKVAKDRRG